MITPSAWQGRSVLVTGHTGFKGGWLSVWLTTLGARVSGYALAPPTDPSFFESTRLGDLVVDRRSDIRDVEATSAAVLDAAPEVVFHLAAQPIVREGYRTPVETYAINVIGTASVLEASRACPSVRAIVVITTDKCYENREWDRGYVETDALGGHDPYSNSKACTELVCDAYRRSFFTGTSPRVGLATARAGNVIGGGDWARDRLIPDLVRAAMAGTETPIRNPGSTRPWQHVLEPLHGYLLLAERLLIAPAEFSEAWNLGPDPGGDAPVSEVLDRLARLWPSHVRWTVDATPHPHEAGKLMLDSTKAHQRLGWAPRLALDDALRLSADWYGDFMTGHADLRAVTESQISYYSTFASYQTARATQGEI